MYQKFEVVFGTKRYKLKTILQSSVTTIEY